MSREVVVPGMSDDDAIIDAMSDAANRIAVEDAGPGPTPAVWHRLQQRRARPARSPFRGLLLAGAGAAAVVALLLVARGVQRGRPLTYVVADGAGEQDGYIRGGDAGSHVRFSDGTHVDIAQGARVSVLSRGPRGARLRVEEGEAHFDVAHLPHAAWSVEAGPYVVYVTGTVFNVRWSGTNEVIEVRMRAGSVQVGGPLLPERVTLRAGQRLTAKLASGELHIGDTRSDEARAGADDSAPPRPQAGAQAAVPGNDEGVPPATNEAAKVVPPPLPASPLAPQPAIPAPSQPPVPPAAAASEAPAVTAAAHSSPIVRRGPIRAAPVSWAPRTWSAVSGNAARVLAEADAHGLDKTLLEVDSPALVALADAARYNSRQDVAVRALLAQRQRFPGTPAANTAAFQLGRLADDRGEVAAGLAWYRRYLSEAANGPYAAEALGRKMLAVERISGRDAARSVAAEYVDRFPNGTYMLQAHGILSNPAP